MNATHGWRQVTRWIGLAVCLIPIVWLAISVAGAGDYLASQVAVQWGNDGQVTRTDFGWTVAIIPGIGCLVSAIVSTVAAFVASARTLPLVYWLSFGFGCMFLAIWLGLERLGSSSGHTSGISPEAFIAAPLFLLLGVIPWAIARLGRTRANEEKPPGSDGTHDEAAREPIATSAGYSVWTGGAVSRSMGAVAVAVAVVVIVSAAVGLARGSVTTSLLTCIVGVVVIVAIVAFGSVHVAIDDSDVRVRSWLGLPRKRIPLTRIRSVNAETVTVGEWGGLGYRVSPRGTGFIIRSGAALELRTDDSTFFVTIDKADEAVREIRSLRPELSDDA